MKELLELLKKAFWYNQQGIKCIMATIVAIEGSGYRRKGTRMLISEYGEMTGAISGGCVEKNVVLEAQQVFENNIPKLFSYDGRYRLGCEGTLYIFLERIIITKQSLSLFKKLYVERIQIEITTKYILDNLQNEYCGTIINSEIYLNNKYKHAQYLSI